MKHRKNAEFFSVQIQEEITKKVLVMKDMAFIILGILGKKFVSILDLKRLNTFIDLMEFLKKKGHG